MPHGATGVPLTGGRLYESFEPRSGTRVFETGRIVVWEPPERLKDGPVGGDLLTGLREHAAGSPGEDPGNGW